MASKETAADTLALLEERLRRVDYVLNGDEQARDTTEPSPSSGSATARLRRLENMLQQLVARSPSAADVLALRKAHPSIFDHTSTDAPSTLPPAAQLAALVLAHAHLYTSVSVNLTQLQDTHLPDAAALVKLVDLQPRMDKARAKQDLQAKEFAELRARSAKAVEKWYEDGVLGMGDTWAGWEERVRDAEIVVRRREAAKRREEGLV